jgi:LmbE family N-acetylglucosaminyl deacetylase
LIIAPVLLAAPASLPAQLRPPSSGGAVVLEQSLRFLGQYKRVLVIGAHPDDEDTELLTILTRHYGAEAAYLSLNRGEGGQNLIGAELGEALGILRTEELLSARRLDGAQQFFTRAYDFGYSKTLEDTWAHWPRDSVLKDVLRVVRTFRPQVIVSVFSGTPRDGHGQHMAAGWVAQEAFRVAGDSAVFGELKGEELIEPWTPLKLYRSTRFDSAATTLRLDGAIVDPAVGKTWRQTAMESRSLHRSQDMGQVQSIGPSSSHLLLLQSRTRVPDTGIWSGIDTSMAALQRVRAQRLVPATIDAGRYEALVREARRSTGPLRLGALLAADTVLSAGTPHEAPPVEIADQLRRLDEAILAAGDVVIDPRLAVPTLAPGGLTQFVCEGRFQPGVTPPPCSLSATPTAWTVEGGGSLPGEHANGYVRLAGPVRLSDGAVPSMPYYLREPRRGDMYRWSINPDGLGGLPFEPPAFTVAVRQSRNLTPAASWARKEVTYRWNDQSLGERRAPVEIVPVLELSLSPAQLPWRRGVRRRARLAVTLKHNGADTLRGTVQLDLPAGWPPVASARFVLAPGAVQEVPFTVVPPASVRDTTVLVRARATADSAFARRLPTREWHQGRQVVQYPHIRSRGYLVPAETRLVFMDLALPQVGLVGYLRGAADHVPEALAAAGMRIEVIPGSALATDLDRFGAIVIGPRAYEVDSALALHNHHLLAYARRGGRVIVQYQQYGYFFGHMAPFPVYVASRLPGTGAAPTVTSTPAASGTIGAALLGGHDRVTDESAPVGVLDAASPVLTAPNLIGARDWEGWVQERGLYFAHAWAPEYRTVVAMSDAGEPPLAGGLLVARVGKGSYIYTGLSFFRQLPAGVPGAFRLFANLLAVGGTR